MGNRRIEMYEYRLVIHRLRQGQSCRSISRDKLISRTKAQQIKQIAKARGWLDEENPLPTDEELQSIFQQSQTSAQSKATAYSEEIRQWVESGINAKVIHRHLVETYGFVGAYNSVQRYVQKLKGLSNRLLTAPLDFKPGEAAQVDFGKGPRLYDERLGCEVDTWFFVMTLCFSRHQYAELITHQDIETWLSCHQHAFNWFGGVLKKVIIDNPKCAITKACYYDPTIQRSYEEFAQNFGFIISACPPAQPKKKGRVEAGVKYIKRNFLPLKQFKSLQSANKQLKIWILSEAGNRTHGTTFKKPLNQFSEIEKHQLKILPTTQPEIAVWQKVKLYRDCHVRYLNCSYSAPHTLFGEELWLKATATTISIYHQQQWMATHSRLHQKGERSTKPEHLPLNIKMYLIQDANWCIKESKTIGPHCEQIIEHLLTDPVRDLLRQAQGVLNLAKRYNKKRLELACQRAITFNAISYHTIKTILKEGLDYEALNKKEVLNQLNDIYRGKAIYQRKFNRRVH